VKIHRSNPAGDFAIIPNETLRDERLSFAARGHLVYLLSLPGDWKTSADDEAERARGLRSKRGEGREAMRRVYRELKDAGYMHLVRSADASGRWSTETHVFDRPCTDVRLADAAKAVPRAAPAETGIAAGGPRRTGNRESAHRPSVQPTVGSPVRQERRQITKTENKPEDQDQPQDQGPGALRLPQVANSKPASSRLNDQLVADDAQHFSRHDSERTTDGTGARARHPAA
jgi:hypothetical protein